MNKKVELAYDSIKLKGKWYFSNGKEERKLPVIIISHEFGLNMLTTARYAKKLAPLGYHVFIYDFSGSGSGSSTGRKSTQMSVLTEKEDLLAVINYVKRQRFVDTENIILGGCSQGGLVTALAAAELTNEIKKVFLLYPALSIPDDARKGTILGRKIDVKKIPQTFWATYVKLGKKYVLDAQALDPWQDISNYKGPVLICHGMKDRIVNYRYAEKAMQVYDQGELALFKKARHLFLIHGKKESLDRIKLFLAN